MRNITSCSTLIVVLAMLVGTSCNRLNNHEDGSKTLQVVCWSSDGQAFFRVQAKSAKRVGHTYQVVTEEGGVEHLFELSAPNTPCVVTDWVEQPKSPAVPAPEMQDDVRANELPSQKSRRNMRR